MHVLSFLPWGAPQPQRFTVLMRKKNEMGYIQEVKRGGQERRGGFIGRPGEES